MTFKTDTPGSMAQFNGELLRIVHGHEARVDERQRQTYKESNQ